MDVLYVEPLLFLYPNMARLPHVVPAISAVAIGGSLPERFTGKDEDLEKAKRYLDPCNEFVNPDEPELT